MTINPWHAYRSMIDGSLYASLEVMPDGVLAYNLMAAKFGFRNLLGDKDAMLDTVVLWRAEAEKRHLVLGPRRVVPWLDKDPKTNRAILVGVAFSCPGCGEMHAVTTTQKNCVGSQWKWNGDYAHPTITPSILCKADKKVKCHVQITDGMAQFQSDCEHALKGVEVELPEC